MVEGGVLARANTHELVALTAIVSLYHYQISSC